MKRDAEKDGKKAIDFAIIEGKGEMLKRRGNTALKIVKQIEDAEEKDRKHGRERDDRR